MLEKVVPTLGENCDVDFISDSVAEYEYCGIINSLVKAGRFPAYLFFRKIIYYKFLKFVFYKK